MKDSSDYDNLITYCSQLGGEIPFHYCRVAADGTLCRKIIICWEFRFEITPWLEKHYTPEELKQAFAPPAQTRLENILACVVRAKAAGDKDY